jgi:lipoyl(octanoyl) transferase
MDSLEKKIAKINVKYLGLSDYEPIWRAMQKFTDERTTETIDELWLVEHPPVFTQGQAGKPEHILAAGDIPVVQVDRGGQVTYHGPGQIVAYPLVDLKRHKIGIKALVHGIEEAIIQTSAEYNVEAKRKEKAPGVYVQGRKIASLGLRVRKGCTFHGLAFNIRMDLEPFARINPCGYAGLEVTQLSELNSEVDFNEVQEILVQHFCNFLNFIKTQDSL